MSCTIKLGQVISSLRLVGVGKTNQSRKSMQPLHLSSCCGLGQHVKRVCKMGWPAIAHYLQEGLAVHRQMLHQAHEPGACS